jgi:hypothetical protein
MLIGAPPSGWQVGERVALSSRWSQNISAVRYHLSRTFLGLELRPMHAENTHERARTQAGMHARTLPHTHAQTHNQQHSFGTGALWQVPVRARGTRRMRCDASKVYVCQQGCIDWAWTSSDELACARSEASIMVPQTLLSTRRVHAPKAPVTRVR